MVSRLALFVAPWQSEPLFAGTVAALDANAAFHSEPAFKDMECAKFAEASHWAQWTLDTEVAAVELLRQRLNAARIDLVGYSGGAAAALAYAVAHPEVLASPRSP